jgi:hypothetical protein
MRLGGLWVVPKLRSTGPGLKLFYLYLFAGYVKDAPATGLSSPSGLLRVL